MEVDSNFCSRWFLPHYCAKRGLLSYGACRLSVRLWRWRIRTT